MKTRFLLAGAFALGTLAAPAFTQAIAYRGKLTAVHANRISAYTPIPMVFRLYGQAEGGRVLWARKYSAKMEADGSFSLAVGDDFGVAVKGAAYEKLADALGAAKGNAWLGLTPGNATDDDASLEFRPRQQLASVPQAYRVALARTSDGLAAETISCTRLQIGSALDASTLTMPDGRVVESMQNKELRLGEGEFRVEGAALVFTTFAPPLTAPARSEAVQPSDYPQLAVVRPDDDGASDVRAYGTKIVMPGAAMDEANVSPFLVQSLGTTKGGVK